MFRNNPLSTKRSFTLLELMITSAILLISIAGLLTVYVNALILDDTSRETVIAANDAQYILEQVKSVAFANIGSYTSPTLTNLTSESIPNPTVTTISTRVKEVVVTVNWIGKMNRVRSFSFTTRIFGEG